MDYPLLSVVIPTIGRPSLDRLLDSIPDDHSIEVIVVGDTYDCDFIKDLAAARGRLSGNNRYWYMHDGGAHCWGHPQRNYGMSVATGQWLMFSQDDNVYAPGAFDAIAHAVAGNHQRPLLFKVMTWQAGVVWTAPMLREGDIDADCLVVPNVRAKLGVWTSRYNGDWDMLSHTAELWDNDIGWRPELIASALPNIEHNPG